MKHELAKLIESALRPLAAPPTPPWNGEELVDLLPAEQRLRDAAVLVGLIPRDAGWHVLLTRRTEHLPHHAGQISFPGGRLEPHDRDATAGAIRETEEELGIEATLVSPIGNLDVYATISAFAVTPVVAVIDPGLVLRPDPREVAEAFEVPLRFFLDPASLKRESRHWRGKERHFYVFPYGERYIWGATAAIMVNFIERLRQHGLEPADLGC